MNALVVHDRFLLVCRRCGLPVHVQRHVECPHHGPLEIFDVVTRTAYRLKEAREHLL